MAWTANTHLFLVHLSPSLCSRCSRCSLCSRASTPLFLLSMKILKKQEIKRQLTTKWMVDDHMDHMDGAWHGMDSKHCSLSLSSQPTGHDAEACTTS